VFSFNKNYKNSPIENKYADELKEIIPFKLYFILHNISKNHNIGTIIRSCAAFGVDTIFMVNRNDIKKYDGMGAMGTAK